MFDWLQNRVETHWQNYRVLFNITVFRYLVTWFAVIPVLASFFSGLETHISANELKLDFLTDLKLPFSLGILWFSSLLFVIALLLYQIFAPQFIKSYSSYSDYKHHLHSPRWIIWESLHIINDAKELPKFFTRLYSKGYITTTTIAVNKNEVKVENRQTVLYFKYNGSAYTIALPVVGPDNNELKDDTIRAEQEIFWEVFGRFSTSLPYVRLSIIVLLLISGLLFTFTLGEHVWYGMSYFGHNFYLHYFGK